VSVSINDMVEGIQNTVFMASIITFTS